MIVKPYREVEWKPVVSGPTMLSISSYISDYKRSGYETDIRNEQGVVRLYVRAETS